MTVGDAIARPRTTIFGDAAYADLATKTAAMFEFLVRNNPLLNGNQRLTVVLTWTFLLNNGYRLEHTEDEADNFTFAAADGKLSLGTIRDWFARRLRRE